MNKYDKFSAIAALLRHIGQINVKIGVGGALVQFHPTYLSLLENKLHDLAPANIKARFTCKFSS